MARIIWSDEARQDLYSIFLKLNSESQSYSKRWINEVFEKTELLLRFPKIGRKVPEINIKNIREVFAGRYRILYNIGVHGDIEVLAIRHTSRPFTEH
ncbi:type II toxin-antitoxin system RelE/ParE family toxin [Dyadobacter sp. 32]|uniref:type II toxin-antitoxin system RelE/ParE family toxin n=1 Tax=Dyadobacter sp. 32 TaxID=538966 RepID=UPI0011EF531E